VTTEVPRRQRQPVRPSLKQIVTEDTPEAIATATYNAANQQVTLGNKSATYDNNGNLITLSDPSGTTTYTWNSRDQLTNISGPGLTASFQYDGVGRRKSKTVNGTATNFLYDKRNVVQELNGTTPTANLITGLDLDEVLQRTDSAGVRSALTDALGSIVALADPTGAIQTQYTYEPFGNTSFSGATSTNTFQYTGRENDGTGLYYYRARFYHPGLQRFVSEDPIEFEGEDVNLYAYVANDPLGFIDPLGEAHRKGKRKSTKDKHERGRARDTKPEKGDARRDAARRAAKAAGCAATLKGCLRGANACPVPPWRAVLIALCLAAYANCMANID
jgi:RHS repeat-associated protein